METGGSRVQSQLELRNKTLSEKKQKTGQVLVIRTCNPEIRWILVQGQPGQITLDLPLK
jgi:hypothetical protein